MRVKVCPLSKMNFLLFCMNVQFLLELKTPSKCMKNAENFHLELFFWQKPLVSTSTKSNLKSNSRKSIDKTTFFHRTVWFVLALLNQFTIWKEKGSKRIFSNSNYTLFYIFHINSYLAIINGKSLYYTV